jgi:hypothetical protein
LYVAQVKADHDKAAKQLTVAKKQIFSVYNPKRLSFEAWKTKQAETMDRLENLEKSAAEGAQVLLYFVLPATRHLVVLTLRTCEFDSPWAFIFPMLLHPSLR